ncbi:MAG: TIGR01244 family sulfur transferase [Pontixanthobacter sp.]
MSEFRTLSDTMLVSPQIGVDDIAAAKAQGVTLIVNNRPDGESPDQPAGAKIEAGARGAGLDYCAIPVTQAGFSMPQVDEMADAVERASGAVLAYCRSGTRSTFLWSLAQAKGGMAPDEIERAANQAGYDIGPIKPTIVMLAAQDGD